MLEKYTVWDSEVLYSSQVKFCFLFGFKRVKLCSVVHWLLIIHSCRLLLSCFNSSVCSFFFFYKVQYCWENIGGQRSACLREKWVRKIILMIIVTMVSISIKKTHWLEPGCDSLWGEAALKNELMIVWVMAFYILLPNNLQPKLH